LGKIVISGANGFIGSHLVERLLSSGLNTLVLISNTSNINDKKKLDESVSYYKADIRDRKAIEDIFSDERPDTCIHLAAKTSVSDSIKNPKETMDINVNGTSILLEACYNNKVKNFVFASSAAVYGDVRELPIKESSALVPTSPYGTSKLMGEELILSFLKAKKIKNSVILRIFNVYGKGQTAETDVITQIAKRLSKGLPPLIYGDGSQTRDFISIDDVVNAILLSLKLVNGISKKKNSVRPYIFNIGTGKPTSIKEIAQRLIELFSIDVQPNYMEATKDKKGILHSYAHVENTRKVLKFMAKKNIETGLREFVVPQIRTKED
jgi:UDP-glucose 4-epimerase